MFRVQRLLWSAGFLFVLAVPAIAQDQIAWLTDLRQARQLAEQNQRLVLLHFWSESCPPCRALEQNVFNQPELIRVLSTNYIPVKVNVMQQPRYADFYKIDRVPTDVIVDSTGRELHRRTSPARADQYMAMLDQVRATYATSGGRMEESTPAVSPRPNYASGPQPTDDFSNSFAQEGASEPINGNPAMDYQASPGQSGIGLSQATPSQRTVVQNQFVSANQPLSGGSAQDSRTQLAGGGGPNFGDSSGAPTPAYGPQNVNAPSSDRPTNSSLALPGNAINLPGNAPPPQGALTGASPYAPPQAPGTTLSPGPNPAANPAANSLSPPAGPGAPAHETVNLPANVPPLAMDGFCPVTLVSMTKWVKGDPRWGAVHRGRTYLLATQAEQQLFLKDPDRFSPALSGYDPVRFAESHQLVDGRREFGVFFAGTYYLFADEAALLKFETQPHGYVNVVRQAMANTAPPGTR